MRDTLILLTNTFPYQNREEFLLQETFYYKDFKKVYIIPLNAVDTTIKKPIDPDITLFRLRTIAPWDKKKKMIGCIKAGFSEDGREEIRRLHEIGRFSKASLQKALVECYKVACVREEIFDIVNRIFEDHPAENVIIYSYWMLNQAKIAADLKKAYPALRIVTRCHGGDLYEYRYKTKYIPFRKTILEQEDMIFAISENGKQYLEKSFPNRKAPVTVARLGTEPLAERPEISNRKGLHIVSCSYCNPVKRLEKLILTLSGLKEDRIQWTHIGDGPEYDKLRQMAREQIPADIPVELSGHQENESIQALYAGGNFQLFINVSASEGIPVSIMEAMSYGIPVIATNVGGVSEMIEDGGNGYLLPKDFKEEELREKIRQILRMPEERFQAMSDRSYEVWREKFHAGKNYREFIRMLKQES